MFFLASWTDSFAVGFRQSICALSVCICYVFPKVRVLYKEGEQSCQQLNFYHNGLLYFQTDARENKIIFLRNTAEMRVTDVPLSESSNTCSVPLIFSSLCDKVVMPVASYQ